MASIAEQKREARRKANKEEAAAKAKLVPPKAPTAALAAQSGLPKGVLDAADESVRVLFESNTLPDITHLNKPGIWTSRLVQWTPEPRPARLTRQQRALVRAFVRYTAQKNGRSRADLRFVQRRNARRMGEEGVAASVYHLQDQGAGFVSVRQLLGDPDLRAALRQRRHGVKGASA